MYKMYKSTTPPREADVMDAIAILTGNESPVLNSSSPDGNCQDYPMSVMNNAGGGHPTIHNDGTAYPPVNPYLGQGHTIQYVSHVNPSSNPDAEQPCTPYPVASQPNDLHAPCAEGMSYPVQDSSAPYPPLSPYSGPAFAAYPIGPLPSASPPSYEASVGHSPQPSNAHKPPAL